MSKALTRALPPFPPPRLFTNHRLELGAGGGLVGLAVALGCRVGTGSVLLTDQEEMLGLMRRNIELNDVAGKATASLLKW